MDVVALIVAAGRGHRLAAEVPKQYLPLAGRLLLGHTVSAFANHPSINGVRVAIHPDDRSLYDQAIAGFDILSPVHGGASRQDSVRLGLESLEERDPDIVLVHDAARPFVPARLIDRVIDALQSHDGALPALAVADTLKRAADGLVKETVGRDGLFRAQTPQGFRYRAILDAHRDAAGSELTDDAAVAERAGLSVALVEGSEENFKVTLKDDIDRAEARLREQTEIRTGMGYDVHRFGPGDHVWLCGVRIDHDQALEGHSDADAGLHAITDALFGAMAEGDIGDHFPPGDDTWRDAASDIFLKAAADRLAAKGGRIVNIDVTLICETPKIKPHREAMRARVGEILGLDVGRIGVKATTTEKLGFTGRKEGLAAQAVVTVALPAPAA